MNTPILLSTGKKVDLTSPTALMDLTPEEYKELLEKLDARESA